MFRKTRIKICMDEQDIKTYRDLAKRAKMPETQLNRMLKKHNFTNDTLSRLCDALDCDPGDILVRVPAPKTVPNGTHSKKLAAA